MVPWIGMQCVIVGSPDHTQLLLHRLSKEAIKF